jgi:hypothetical protein
MVVIIRQHSILYGFHDEGQFGFDERGMKCMIAAIYKKTLLALYP